MTGSSTLATRERCWRFRFRRLITVPSRERWSGECSGIELLDAERTDGRTIQRYFTHYVSNRTWENERDLAPRDPVFRHTAGSLFKARGVRAGDIVYFVTVRSGTLFVAGKLEVGRICGKDEAVAELGDDDLWNASEHIIASAGTSKNFDLSVPPETTEGLLFITARGSKGLKFRAPGFLDEQTLRGVRELDPKSAADIDQLLPPLQQLTLKKGPLEADNLIPEEAFPEGVADAREYFEGSTKSVTVNVYERNLKAREACIAHYGVNCFICGFNFKTAYGDDGAGFIHIHHLKPLSELGKEYKLDPLKDLRPVCPNCHAMIHKRTPAYTIEEVKRLIDRATE